MESHNDRRIAKTKKILHESLLELLDYKSMNHITIKELCDAANINRNTFYYHFNSIDDLLLEIINNFKDETMHLTSPETDLYQYAVELCTLYRHNSHLIAVLLNGNVNVSFIYQLLNFDYIPTYNVLSKVHSNSDLTDLMSSYIQVSTFTIIAKWLKQCCSQPEEQIAHILCQLWNTQISY